MADIDETLRKAGWFEVAQGAGVWRAPDEADDPSGRKYTTANAALEAVQAEGGGTAAETEEHIAKKSEEVVFPTLSAAASVDAHHGTRGSTPVAR